MSQSIFAADFKATLHVPGPLLLPQCQSTFVACQFSFAVGPRGTVTCARFPLSYRMSQSIFAADPKYGVRSMAFVVP